MRVVLCTMRRWPGSLSSRLARTVFAVVLLACLGASATAHTAPAQQSAAAKALTVVAAGPTGETDSLAEANEVRVTFSEPMVVLGKIPQPVTAPFFKMTPAVPGTFRW